MADVTSAHPGVKIDGTLLAERYEVLIEQLTVTSETDSPDSCSIAFHDPERDLVKSLGIDVGGKLEVATAPVGTAERTLLFDGLIYSLEFEFDEQGAFLHVVGYDRSYPLRIGRRTRNFNDVKDSDVASTIAREVGLKAAKIDATPVTHKHLAQINETNWDFLKRRARALDHEVFVVRDGLHFTKSEQAGSGPAPGDHRSTDPMQLVPGHSLQYLRVRVTGAQQVGEVEVRGWDVAQKKALVSTASVETRSVARSDDNPAAIAGKVGTATTLRAMPSFGSQAECDALAGAEAERHGASFNFAEGIAVGNPALRAGALVSLGQTGRFDGKYVVSSSRHVFGHAGYHTHVVLSGCHDRSLLGLTRTAPEVALAHGGGVVPAVVTNLKDPDSRGRVKLKLPWLSDDYETDWARVAHIGAGDERGLSWFPEVDDEVLVGFIGNDQAMPVVMSGLHNGKDAPPFPDAIDTSSGRVEIRGLKTRAGHVLRFDDTKGSEQIELATADEKIRIVLDQSGKALTIEVDQDIKIHASGKLDLAADGDVSIAAKGKATLSGDQGVSVTSSASVEVSGSQIKLN